MSVAVPLQLTDYFIGR